MVVACSHFLTIFICNSSLMTPLVIHTAHPIFLILLLYLHPALISNLSVEREFSDHYYISFCLSKHLCDYSNVTRKVYLYGKGNFDAIRSDTHDFQSKFFACHLNLELLMITGSFKHALSSSITKHVPTKLVKSSDKRPQRSRSAKAFLQGRPKTSKKFRIFHHFQSLRPYRPIPETIKIQAYKQRTEKKLYLSPIQLP